MSTRNQSGGDALLVALQRGIPLVARPFAELGVEPGLSEEAVLARVRALFDRGLVRRFGAVFDSRSLGYGSTLCAVDVPGAELESAAARLAPHPGVTHCYEREGHPNLWFTLTARADAFERELQAIGARLAPYPLLNLPALRRFKVEVVLDAPGDGPAAEPARTASGHGTAVAGRPFNGHDKALIRLLQGDIPVAARPFDALAGKLSMDVEHLLERLRELKRDGAMRRIGIILRHRNAGFVANGMCVWRVPPADVERVGQLIARAPEVTHCYERPAGPAFPFNLFAMVHARERDAAGAIFNRLSQQAGLEGGAMLTSLREFKKSSPVFFCEDDE